MSDSPMLAAALEYHAQGFCIFPLTPRSPKPHKDWIELRGKGWADLQNQRPTEEEIRDWWSRWPDANIAIITGRISGLVVVDVDAQHGGTPEGLPDTGCIARTGQGGQHRLYRYPPDAINVPCQVNSEKARDKERRGRDVRADGGYIVAAPSIHYKTGKRYTWEVFEPARLGDPPKFSLSPVVEEVEKKEPWLTTLIEGGTRPGQRNDDVTRFAGYLASKGIPLDVGLALTHKWMESQSMPLHHEEIDVTVRSVYRTEARRNPERLKGKPKRSLFKTLSLNTFMLKYGDHEIRWTVEEWLPESTIGILVSPPGGFKTWLTFDLAVSVASGQPFLGRYPVSEPGPVLIVQQEDFNTQTAERNALIIMNRLGLKKPESDGDELVIPYMPSDRDLPLHFHADRMLRFDDTEVMDALEEFVREIKPKLVIVDPLYQATSTDEYMVKAASDMSRLKTMRDVHGTSFLIVHHTKKSAGFERLDAWGSQFINAFSECTFHVRRPEGEPFSVVKRSFKVAGLQPPMKLTYDIRSDDYHYSVNAEEISKEEAEKLIQPGGAAAAVGAEGYPKSLSKKIVAALVEGGPANVAELALTTGATEEKVIASLKTLLRKGDVQEDASGAWTSVIPDLT